VRAVKAPPSSEKGLGAAAHLHLKGHTQKRCVFWAEISQTHSGDTKGLYYILWKGCPLKSVHNIRLNLLAIRNVKTIK